MKDNKITETLYIKKYCWKITNVEQCKHQCWKIRYDEGNLIPRSLLFVVPDHPFPEVKISHILSLQYQHSFDLIPCVVKKRYSLIFTSKTPCLAMNERARKR